MKNFFFLIAFVFATTILQAQNENIQKGTWMAGGSLSLSNTLQIQGNNNSTTTQLNLSPQAGYFLHPRFALTLGADFSTTRFASGRSNSFSIQPGARFYVYKGLFASAQAGFGRVSTTLDGAPGTSNNNVVLYEGGLGYSLFLNKYVAIEPALVYRSANFEQTGANTSFTGATKQFNFSIGFRIFL